jgi:Sulfotransferase domain
MFAEELVEAYPDAKVILTTRSTESWYNSMIRTVCNPRYYSRLFRVAAWFDQRESDSLKMSDKYREILWHNDFERYGRTFFEQHNESIRNLVPVERLLEFEAKYVYPVRDSFQVSTDAVVRQGWGPLCSFLGKDVPAEPYPLANDSESYYSGQEEYVWLVYRRFFQKIAFSSLAVVVGFVAWRAQS